MFELSQELILNTNGFRMAEQSAPTNNLANSIWLYSRDKSGVSGLFYKDDSNVEHDLSVAIVSGTGIVNRLAYWNSTSSIAANAALTTGRIPFADANGLPTDDTNLFWDNTGKQLGIGISSGLLGQLHIQSSGANALEFIDTYGATFSPNIVGRRARGTSGSPTAVQADDVLLSITARGFGSTVFASAARVGINQTTGEIWTDAHQGTQIKFFTTPLLSTSIAEVFRIGPSGQWGIGGANFGTAGDVFTSGGASAAPTWTAPVVPAIGGAITGGTVGSVLFVKTGPVFGQDNAKFFWDDINFRLGIGLTTPNAPVTISQASATAQPLVILNPQDGTGNYSQIHFQFDYNNTSIASSIRNIQRSGGANGASLAFYTDNAAGSHTQKLFLRHNGNIGINQANPNFMLDIISTGKLGIAVQTTGANLSNPLNTFTDTTNNVTVVETVNGANGVIGTFTSHPFQIVTNADVGADRATFFNGNIALGGSAFPSVGTNGLILPAGTALSSMALGTAGEYAQTVSGVTHLIAIASDGTVVQLV